MTDTPRTTIPATDALIAHWLNVADNPVYAVGLGEFNWPMAIRSLAGEVEAARQMRDAILAYENAEERGFTRKAIDAWNAKERACERYDAVRAGGDVQHDR